MVRLQLDEEAVFKVAVEITQPETRADYVDQVCSGNEALLHRVSMLLDAHMESPNYLESPPPGIAATLELSSNGVAGIQGAVSRFACSYRAGAPIGPFKIREQLAEGGMGVVYVAEHTEPVRRKVALKSNSTTLFKLCSRCMVAHELKTIPACGESERRESVFGNNVLWDKAYFVMRGCVRC